MLKFFYKDIDSLFWLDYFCRKSANAISYVYKISKSGRGKINFVFR
ncbi:uncharacterized protein METZ01_LOCUS419177, partial [marine metagenome]